MNTPTSLHFMCQTTPQSPFPNHTTIHYTTPMSAIPSVSRPTLPSLLLLLSLSVIPDLFAPGATLCPEGLTLLAFKSAITSDPTSALAAWNETDADPCGWTGVACANFTGFPVPRVVAVAVANRDLSGRVPTDLGRLPFLRRLDLRGNHLTGEIPQSFSNATSLHSLFLHSNSLSGVVPFASLCALPRLQNLDLSGNSLSGVILSDLRACRQLQRLHLAGNRLTGELPAGVFPELRRLLHLDLSSNGLTGPIPADLGELRSLTGALNLSNNRLSGEIPAALAGIPPYAAIDLRNNELSGEVPRVELIAARGDAMLFGNPGLCGYPLEVACRSTRSAAAAPVGREGSVSRWLIVGISAADVAGVALVGLLVLYVYWKVRGRGRGWWCFRCGSNKKKKRRKKKGLLWCWREEDEGEGEEEWSAEEEGEGEGEEKGELVAVDGGFGVGLEELLRASAYVVGKGGKGIVYKVAVRDGTTVAVRRLEGNDDGYIGGGNSTTVGKDGGGYKEFKAEVEAISKVRHPNVVRLRAYYWSHEEKLLVTDFVPGGNLASALRNSARSGDPPLSWSLRLRIIKGVAHGLSYLHECSPRKFVHGSVKPSNILLHGDFKPSIADFGLNRLLGIANSNVSSSSLSASYTNLDLPITKHSSLKDYPNNYRAPEARLACCSRPSQKWDVYSFGMVVLELLTGKSPEKMEVGELVRWVRKGFDRERPIVEMGDAMLLQEVQLRKEVVEVFRVALNCTETDPESRPRMKAVVEVLDKLGS